MSTTLAQPAPAQPTPAYPRPLPHRWTVTEFNRMGDMGWFEGKRAFLLDGVILEQGPMDPPHANALGLVLFALQAAFGAGLWVRVQSPLHVDAHNDPLPDFAVVVGGPRDYAGIHPSTAALVVEVSDTTLRIDLTEKAERYATARVADYWVLDLNARVLHVLRDPQPLPEGLGATAYRTHLTLGPTERVAPLAAPQASVLVGDLLP
jgi:Uma2 family endonuclease